MATRVYKWTRRVSLLLFAAFVAIGLALLFVVPIFLRKQVADQDFLGWDGNGTYNLMFKKWQKPEYAMQMEIWTFSVENVADVIGKGAKPRLVEKGPYTFSETQEKKWFSFEKNNTHILYRNNRQYVFNQTLSCSSCLLKDKVNVPNVIFQKLVDAANTSSLYRFVIEEACRLRGESAFITTTVGELLFEGYDDPLISAICNHTIMRSICATLGVPPRIGLFYGQNNTDDGVYKIHTGLGSVKDIGHVYSWNNMTTLNTTYWYGQGARMINGTDGQLFKPDLEVNQPLHIFVGQICRTVAMDHKGYATFEDVPSYRYGPSRSMNDIQLERSLGFCNPASPIFFEDSYIQEKGCSPPGILDASSCLPSSPRIYISQPHFLNSPPPIREALVGLKEPSESSDSTFVDIEPKSGVVVQAKRRSQINVGVLRGNLVSLQNMSNIIVPIIWLNETAVFDADTRAQLLQLVSIAHTSKTVSIVLLVVSGMLLLLYAGSFLVEYHMKKREEEVGSDIGGDEQPLIADLNPEEQ